MKIVYNLILYIAPLLARIATLFSHKAKLLSQGHNGLISKIERDFNNSQNQETQIVWVHCSSVGEFEQARPVIEWIKSNTEDKIVLTFFSPSGYELRKNYDKADWVYYLPWDTPSNARRFVKAIKPKKTIFTKYDLWYNFISNAKKGGSKLYLISAIFSEDQSFFKWWGGFFRGMLRMFDTIFVQDNQSITNLNTIGLSDNVILSGDTRFDRVYHIANESKEFEIIQRFSGKEFTIVAGSSWGPDEEILSNVLDQLSEVRLIIAPHEIGKERINSVEKRFERFGVLKYSYLSGCNGNGNGNGNGIDIETNTNTKANANTEHLVQKNRVLIIDSIGILSALYKYADFSYIGGGFGAGIHNTLEAAVYGSPIAFGPKYQKFKEAKDLIALNGAQSINTAKELYTFVNQMVIDRELRKEKGDICKNYVETNCGATQSIVTHLYGK